MRPGLPAVGRMIDAVARDHVVARPRLARADPHVVLVARRDRDRADRLRPRFVEHGPPVAAAVGRLPHAAAGGARVEQRRIEVGPRDGRDAAAGDRRPDAAPVQRRPWARRRLGEGLGAGDASARGRPASCADAPRRARTAASRARASAATGKGRAEGRAGDGTNVRRERRTDISSSYATLLPVT